MILTRQEYQSLLDSPFFEPTCERIILTAVPMIGGIQLNLPETDLEYFLEHLAAICNHEPNKNRIKYLDAVYEKLSALSDLLLENLET